MAVHNIPIISSSDKYTFLAEWFEPESSSLRKFYLSFYPSNSTVELYDLRKKRLFLKRTKIDNLEKRDIFVGNTVQIFARHIRITGYANEYTRKMMGVLMQKTCVIIKPDGMPKKGNIFQMLIGNGFRISELRMLKIPMSTAESLYEKKKDSLGFSTLLSYIGSLPVIVMEVINDQGVEKLKELAGPTIPDQAKVEAPQSIRACFGTDEMHNAIHCSDSVEEANRELELFFGKFAPPANVNTDTVTLENSTCCVIKPHAVRDGLFGDIIAMIEGEGYTITAMRMFHMDSVNAEEFLEVYRGVYPEYTQMVSEMVDGGVVAMEITGPTKEDTPIDFRNLVGPTDPDMARQLRPNTIRARFGKNKVQNAVHVTDLPEDAILEVEYFFKILVL